VRCPVARFAAAATDPAGLTRTATRPRGGSDTTAAVLLVLTAAFFGATWVAAPWATHEIPPMVVACVRFATAAVLLFGWCRLRGIPIPLRRADIPIVLGVTATSVVGYNVLFLYGVTLAPASHGAVITPGLIPVFALVLARILFGEPIRWQQAVGVAICLVGLALVVGPAFAGDPAALAGDVLYGVSALLWATYTILGRKVTARFHVAAITCVSGALGALVFLPLGLLDPVGFGALTTASPRALAGLAYLGSLGTAVGFVTFYLGVQRIGSARASAYTVLIPLFGVSLTVAVLGESFVPISFLGAAIVIGGLWLTQARAGNRTGAADRTEG
jgi:drug/metabolite transporter (DMT)-like permease